ncbi:MAG: hypothetical protein R2712_12465 [Vicinamibacterales bacterium]
MLELAAAMRTVLGDRTIDDLPAGEDALAALGAALLDGDDIPREVQVANAMNLAIAGIVNALVHTGWEMHSELGRPIHMVRGTDRVAPGTVVSELASGEMTPEAWRATCDRLGITGLRLAPEPTPEPAPAAA